MRHLPSEPLAVSALPPVTSREEYEAARARLLVKEKAHSRQGDAIAAERRRLPMIEIPFTVLNMFTPSVVRETTMQFRLLPAQNPDINTPKKGQSVNELRTALQASYDEMAALFDANPHLDYRGMLYRHPIIGSNNVLQMVRIVVLHERRHQSQIQDLLCLPQFSKVA